MAKPRVTALRPGERPEPAWTPRRVAWWLAGAIALLAALSVAEQYVIHILGRDDLEDFLITLDLDAESNLPTWFASMSLLACALLLGRIAARTRAAGGRFAGHWRALAVMFVVLSLDESARLHEHLGRLQGVWDTHGVFYFAWVIPGALAVLAVTAVFARFLFQLPAATRGRFLAAGTVFVAGALVVEAISGWRAETMGMNNMTHSLIATVEEVLELAGVAMFLVALLRHLRGMAPGVPGAEVAVDRSHATEAKGAEERRAAA
jgi:hypothetical protein